MKDSGASAEGNALAAAHAVLGKERKGMKRLTSILLALLMLVPAVMTIKQALGL